MKLSNGFRIVWWAALLLLIGSFLLHRRILLVTGKAQAIDLVLGIVWIALVLLPVFGEISIFGMSFREQMEGLKSELENLRLDVRNSVEVRNQVFLPGPPPDSQLPKIEQSILADISEAKKGHAASLVDSRSIPPVPGDSAVLFSARYNIEKEVRRIWRQYADSPPFGRRFAPTMQLATELREWQLIDDRLERAIRDVWRVASPGVHGEDVSAAKVSFVREVAPDLIVALQAIH